MTTDGTRDWTFVLDHVLPRLGMHTGRETFERAVCFVIGFDQALGGRLDPLLNEWARNRYGQTSRSWPGVILELATREGPEGAGPSDLGDVSPEQDRAAIALLSEAILHVRGLV